MISSSEGLSTVKGRRYLEALPITMLWVASHNGRLFCHKIIIIYCWHSRDCVVDLPGDVVTIAYRSQHVTKTRESGQIVLLCDCLHILTETSKRTTVGCDL